MATYNAGSIVLSIAAALQNVALQKIIIRNYEYDKRFTPMA